MRCPAPHALAERATSPLAASAASASSAFRTDAASRGIAISLFTLERIFLSLDVYKRQPKKPRTADWWLIEASTVEWNYRIVPPDGLVPKELPADTTVQVGPALLTEKFSKEKDGVVAAHLIFDTVKRRYTVAEATELRKMCIRDSLQHHRRAFARRVIILLNAVDHALTGGEVHHALAANRMSNGSALGLSLIHI